jgi:ADP-ribosylation factor 1/2
MGLYLSKLFEIFSSLSEGEPKRILMLGLDGAGKTTILYKVKLNENVVTIPTIGFNVETVSPCKGVTFTMWDVGGQTKLRPLWRHYFQNTQGLLYVIDSSDQERMKESAEELHSILEDENMNGVSVVVLANKQDLPNRLSVTQLVAKLGLDTLNTNRNKWHIQGCCAVSGEGVYEGMKIMADLVKESSKR